MYFCTQIIESMKTILITGAAGFIGANLVMRLLRDMKEGIIVGLDNLNNYYDVSLKEYRLKQLKAESERLKAEGSNVGYEFVKGDLADKEEFSIFQNEHSGEKLRRTIEEFEHFEGIDVCVIAIMNREDWFMEVMKHCDVLEYDVIHCDTHTFKAHFHGLS